MFVPSPPFSTTVLLVITGTRWPIRMFAFSWFLARMRGLARTFVVPTDFIRSIVTGTGLTLIVVESCCRRSSSTSGSPASGVGASVTCCGYLMPSSSRRVRVSSSTSTSIITSDSGTSTEAISRSAIRTASGVSRMTIAPARSSTNSVFAFSMVFSISIARFGSVFVR